MTVDEILTLRKRQHSCCAICGTHEDEIPHGSFVHSPLVVDHDHRGGGVRGLLCPTCNVGLGQFKDDPALLANAIAYLTN